MSGIGGARAIAFGLGPAKRRGLVRRRQRQAFQQHPAQQLGIIGQRRRLAEEFTPQLNPKLFHDL